MATDRKWLVPLLGLSLAVNVFIAGVMLGKKIQVPPPQPDRAPRVDFNLQRFSPHLSQAEHQKIRRILRSERGALAERYKSVRASEDRIKSLISAEQVDRQALLQALKAHGALMQQLHAPMQRVMMEVIAELSHETREKMAGDMFKGQMLQNMRRGGGRFRSQNRPPDNRDAEERPPEASPTESEPNSSPDSL